MGNPFTSVHIVPKLNAKQDPKVLKAVDVISTTASRLGVSEVNRDGVSTSTLVIAVGGDGTMLEAMRIAAQANATAIGVNLGNVGFLTDLSIRDHFARAIADALVQLTDTIIVERTVLTTFVCEDTIACNEISVSQLYADSLITYRLRIGDVDAGIHKANGILIATPTGSTAYSLSVGGALMMPEMEAIQIAPVAPATMTSRPIIVPTSAPIELQVWGGGPITVRADGQVVGSCEGECIAKSTKENPYVVTVSPYRNKAKVLHFDGWNFFDVLTEKLGWKHE